jgi:hypothetical protein
MLTIMRLVRMNLVGLRVISCCMLYNSRNYKIWGGVNCGVKPYFLFFIIVRILQRDAVAVVNPDSFVNILNGVSSSGWVGPGCGCIVW